MAYPPSQPPIQSRVPQWSVIGPLLFLFYINDLPDCVSPGSPTRLFANDSALYWPIITMENDIKLQEDLNKLQEWGIDLLKESHPKKCQLVSGIHTQPTTPGNGEA